MGLSIPAVAREHADFINNELQRFSTNLNPASMEDAEVVRRAVFSVRNKSVLFERFSETTAKLFTVVQDVKPAEVTVDFYQEHLLCTCAQPMCRHQLGVLLGMYQYFGSVQEWRAKWAEKSTIQLQSLATERTPEAWQRLVDEVMLHLLPTGRRVESYSVTAFLENAHAKLRRYMPLEREWQPIYKVYIELAVLNKIWAHFLSTDSPIHSDYFSYAIERRYQVAMLSIEELDKSRLFATDPFYDAIQLQLRTFILQPTGCTSIRLAFYLACWQHLFLDAKRARLELEALLLLDEQNDIPTRVLRIVPTIIVKDRDRIIQLLHELEATSIHLYQAIAQYAFSIDAHLYAELLLKATLPHLAYFIQQCLPAPARQQFIKHTYTLYEKIYLNEQEELQLYGAFGRHGVQPYADYLLKGKRFEEWAALHQLYLSSIPYLESIGLKTVLAEQPAALLPLYHVYAMEEVAQKSRLNYKQAVRIWKHMKAAAKKAGKTAYFDAYIEQIRMQFKRLRALQEELDKANLRSDKL